MNMDAMRNLVGILNRYRAIERENPRVIENIYTPPFKGFKPRRHQYTYPTQLSGLHSDERQKITIQGSANQGSHFGGPSLSSRG